MAKYNPNNHYVVAGMKMHPVGGIIVTSKNSAQQETQKFKPVETYGKKQQLEKEKLKHQTKAGLYGAAVAAEQFKYLRLEDIKAYAPNIARRLQYGGLREGQRSLEQMQQMFEKIPPAERVGISFEDALHNIENYLSDKHFGHRQAYVNGGLGDANNIYLENARDNLARGGKDMTPEEIRNLQYQYHVDNVVGAARNGLKAAPKVAAMAAFYVAVPVILENIFAVANVAISEEEAYENVIQAIGQAALAGAIGGFAIYFAAALIPGVAPALIEVAPFANVAGKVFFAQRLFNIVYKNRNTVAKFFRKNLNTGFVMLAFPFYPLAKLIVD